MKLRDTRIRSIVTKESKEKLKVSIRKSLNQPNLPNPTREPNPNRHQGPNLPMPHPNASIPSQPTIKCSSQIPIPRQSKHNSIPKTTVAKPEEQNPKAGIQNEKEAIPMSISKSSQPAKMPDHDPPVPSAATQSPCPYTKAHTPLMLLFCDSYHCILVSKFLLYQTPMLSLVLHVSSSPRQ